MESPHETEYDAWMFLSKYGKYCVFAFLDEIYGIDINTRKKGKLCKGRSAFSLYRKE